MTGPTNPISSPDDAVRVGHNEREQVIELLGSSMSGGYLTLDEFEQRVSRVHEVATRGELRSLLADLPAAGALHLPGSPLPGPASGAVAAPTAAPPGWAPVEEVELRGSMEANVTRRGRWRVPPRLVLSGSMTTIKVDLSEAEVPIGGVDVDVQATWSTVRIWLGPTMRLATDQFETSMWITLKDKTGPVPAGPGITVNVRGKPNMTTVVVRRAK